MIYQGACTAFSDQDFHALDLYTAIALNQQHKLIASTTYTCLQALAVTTVCVHALYHNPTLSRHSYS